MERPLCPICDTKHFAREPHEFKEEGGLVHVVAPGREFGGAAPVKPVSGEKKFDRAAYMREYMRGYMRKRRKSVAV